MERAIIKSEDGKQYFFYDDPEWEVDYKKSEVEGVLDIDDETGFHACEKSGLYENMEGILIKYRTKMSYQTENIL